MLPTTISLSFFDISKVHLIHSQSHLQILPRCQIKQTINPKKPLVELGTPYRLDSGTRSDCHNLSSYLSSAASYVPGLSGGSGDPSSKSTAESVTDAAKTGGTEAQKGLHTAG